MLQNAKDSKCVSNIKVMEHEGKTEAYKDKEKVFLPVDKGSIMVVINKNEIMGGKDSYKENKTSDPG